MNSRERLSVQLTHRLASEINLALSESDMTIADLAKKIGDSEGFIRRVLAGEDGVGKYVKVELISDVAWATGQWISISINPNRPVETSPSVESGDQ